MTKAFTKKTRVGVAVEVTIGSSSGVGSSSAGSASTEPKHEVGAAIAAAVGGGTWAPLSCQSSSFTS